MIKSLCRLFGYCNNEPILSHLPDDVVSHISSFLDEHQRDYLFNLNANIRGIRTMDQYRDINIGVQFKDIVYLLTVPDVDLDLIRRLVDDIPCIFKSERYKIGNKDYLNALNNVGIFNIGNKNGWFMPFCE